MNRLTNSDDPIDRAVAGHAIDAEQAATAAVALPGCRCANCIADAAANPFIDEAERIALLRLHAWSTSRGPMQ